MRQLNHFRWLLISLVFMAPVCWSSAAPLPNYEGWEITITGKETMTAKYHDDIAYPLDDECTVTHSGTAKYRVTRDPERGAGMESYSVELVSSNAQIEVTGQGKAVLEGRHQDLDVLPHARGLPERLASVLSRRRREEPLA